MDLIPVILCGGSGTRLWPLSRAEQPKQFVSFEGGKTLFQDTVERVRTLIESRDLIVVSNKNHLHLLRQNLHDVEEETTLILEPEPKNTAPAILLAALSAIAKRPEAVLLVVPSDHVIKEAALFQKAVTKALELADTGALITFGVHPTRPETGFGYIQKGESVGTGFKVRQFIEKPCLERAKQMLAEGGFYWNSGMFVFKAQAIIDEVKELAPKIYNGALRALEDGKSEVNDGHFTVIKPAADKFHTCPSDSVDYAVMEKTQKAVVIPLNVQWNDMGAWSSFYLLGTKDDKRNVVCGDVITASTEGCYINATNRLVATVGLRDLAIVETKDVVFVSPLDRVQEAKNIVGKLKSENRSEAVFPTVVNRPWGSFEFLAKDGYYQTKRIIVQPGEQLSLQYHRHRSEHWIVVHGEAEITIGEKTKTYYSNESVYIPQGCVHRLSNRTNEPVIVIEVQYGDYLGEDDIIRLEDKYNR